MLVVETHRGHCVCRFAGNDGILPQNWEPRGLEAPAFREGKKHGVNIRPLAAGDSALSVVRSALTGALVAALLFMLCWIGTFIPLSSPTHAYISLFTPASMSSTLALVEGTCWSLVFGAVIGALIALVSNALGGLFRS